MASLQLVDYPSSSTNSPDAPPVASTHTVDPPTGPQAPPAEPPAAQSTTPPVDPPPAQSTTPDDPPPADVANNNGNDQVSNTPVFYVNRPEAAMPDNETEWPRTAVDEEHRGFLNRARLVYDDQGRFWRARDKRIFIQFLSFLKKSPSTMTAMSNHHIYKKWTIEMESFVQAYHLMILYGENRVRTSKYVTTKLGSIEWPDLSLTTHPELPGAIEVDVETDNEADDEASGGDESSESDGSSDNNSIVNEEVNEEIEIDENAGHSDSSAEPLRRTALKRSFAPVQRNGANQSPETSFQNDSDDDIPSNRGSKRQRSGGIADLDRRLGIIESGRTTPYGQVWANESIQRVLDLENRERDLLVELGSIRASVEAIQNQHGRQMTELNDELRRSKEHGKRLEQDLAQIRNEIETMRNKGFFGQFGYCVVQ